MEKNDITTKVLIALVSIMIIAVIVLGVLLYKTSEENKKLGQTTTIITDERNEIKAEFAELLDEYENLESSNDSLNAEINSSREKIQTLIEEINNTKNWASGMKKKYEAELGTLRSIMRHYVFQIDSLNTINQQLTAENEMIKVENTRIRTEIDEVVEQNSELSSRIEDASILNASNIGVIFLNSRDKETNKSGKVEKIKVTFTLARNQLAEAGARDIFLRIVGPDGYVLSTGHTFTAGDENLAYSDKRTVTYENDDLPVAIVYKVTSTLLKGNYKIELYTDGYKIGESKFTIDK